MIRTKDEIHLMSNQALLAYYNKIAGKSVTRFPSRAIGEERAFLAQSAPKKAAKKPAKSVSAKKPAAAKKPVAAVAAKPAGGGKSFGRPAVDFKLVVTEGTGTVRESSLRGKILAHMKQQPASSTIRLSDLVSKFGQETKGAIQKLTVCHWVKRIDE